MSRSPQKHLVPMLQIRFTTFLTTKQHTSYNSHDSIESKRILPCNRNNHHTPSCKSPHHIPTNRQDVWTHRPTNLALDVKNTHTPPGLLINNTPSDPTMEKLIIGSDGSLHLHKQVAAAAWIISTGDTKHLSATFLMTIISLYTSHRIELE